MASTARLLALADMVRSDPTRAEAELRALAAEAERDAAAQRRTAGRASAAARELQMEATRDEAMRLAAHLRQADPRISQERLAADLRARIGPVLPGEDALRRWVRGWERTGHLAARAQSGKQRPVASQTARPTPATLSPMEAKRPAPPPEPRSTEDELRLRYPYGAARLERALKQAMADNLRPPLEPPTTNPTTGATEHG